MTYQEHFEMTKYLHVMNLCVIFCSDEGVRPTNKKLQDIKNIMPLTNKEVVRKFIGLVNYYGEIWAC